VVVEGLDPPDLDAAGRRRLLRQHHRGDDTIPGGLGIAPAEPAQAFGQQRRLGRRPDVPERALDVAHQTENLAGGRCDIGGVGREPQVADTGPAPLGSDHDAIPLVENPDGALGRLRWRSGSSAS